MATSGYKLRVNGGTLVNEIIDVGNVTTFDVTNPPYDIEADTDYDNEVAAYDEFSNLSAYCAPFTIHTDSPFTSPMDIPGCILWAKADSLSLGDGDNVSSWTDSSGNSHTLTQATGGSQPTYHTNVINGLPVVRNIGTSYMNTPSITSIPTWTVFFVAKSSDANPTWFLGAGSDNTAILHSFVGAEWDFFNGSTFTSFGTLSTSVFQVLTCAAGGSTTGVWRLGTSFSLAAHWDGDLAEIVVYDNLLSGSDQALVQGYLTAKYGL